LAAAGVCVVSGLALGIDAAAHAGALAAVGDRVGTGQACASTVGVAASGVDVVYPPQHAALWRQVVRDGAVLSETPPGMPAQSWRFPTRNRIIAALVQMVVVVESHASGGSWHTVEAALGRGTDVGAVPGPVHGAASVGTNTLLHEGAIPVRGAWDVLDALGVFRDEATSNERPPRPSHQSGVAPQPGQATDHKAPARLGRLEARVLGAVAWQPLCLEDIVERSGLPAAAVVVALERLEDEGAIYGEAGWWCRRAQPSRTRA